MGAQLRRVRLMTNQPRPLFVRCKDNTLVRTLLTVGAIYEVTGSDGYGNYRVRDKWLTKGRFEPVTFTEWLESRQ